MLEQETWLGEWEKVATAGGETEAVKDEVVVVVPAKDPHQQQQEQQQAYRKGCVQSLKGTSLILDSERPLIY